MGTTDEHWCTICKRTVDKKKDKYLDFELIHQAALPLTPKWKKPKGIVCIEKDPKLKELVNAIMAAGNPPFMVKITCESYSICPTYKPTSKPNVNCGQIAVIGDTVYCKRSHPGRVKLMVERSERERVEREIFMRFIRRAFKKMPPGVREAFEGMAKGIWQPPSAVVKASPQPGASGSAHGQTP